jgi:beta-galactosidase GanA
MEVRPEAQVIARFESGESYLNGRPAATVRKMGDGMVFRLAFWPGDDSLVRLMSHLAGGPSAPLKFHVPPGVIAVPRTDGSMFLVNTGERPVTIPLTRAATDQVSGEKVPAQFSLRAFGVAWLE